MRKILLVLLTILLVTSPLCAGGNRWGSKPPLGSQINWGHPLSRGLVGCWLMNESGGRIIKDIYSFSTNTIGSGNSWKVTNKGSALNFDGSTNVPNLGNRFIRQDLPYSIVVMASIPSSTAQIQSLVTKSITGGKGPEFAFFVNEYNTNNRKVLFEWGDGTTGANAIGGVFPQDCLSHLVIATKTLGNTNIYLNGINIATSTSTQSQASSSHPFCFGKFGGDDLFALSSGNSISFVCLYNRALSPQEIQSLYQDPYQFIKSPTVWSKFSTAIAATGNFFMMFD